MSDYDESATLKCSSHHSHVEVGNEAFLLLKGTSESEGVARLRRSRSSMLPRFSINPGLINFSLCRTLNFYVIGFVGISAQGTTMVVPSYF